MIPGGSSIRGCRKCKTFERSDGNIGYGTESSETNINSHVIADGSSEWSRYEFAGRLAVDSSRASIGVTLYSGYPASDRYYRVRRSSGGSFHLSSHPDGEVACVGTSDTGVNPRSNLWYGIRVQALPEGGGTRVRARVWESGAPEPGSWQIDCLDSRATLVRGAPVLWSMGSGLELWNDLEVVKTTP